MTPTTGLPVYSPEEIKGVTLQYCVNLLTNRKPKPEYAEIINQKYELHEQRMNEVIFNDLEELTPEMFNSALRHLSSKHGEKYKFILKAGPAYLNALLNLFILIWKTEQIPQAWHSSSLVQLYKSSSDKHSLTNMRFIHTKSDTAKLFGHIVISEAKSNIFKYMSKYQIATKPGHRASEHLYAVMSVLGTIQKKKKAIIVSMWDLKAFFDSENLIDCMSELYKKKIKGKLYRLIFRMNQNIRISVKTAVGETEEKDWKSVHTGSL